ncbi:MAG: hydrolase [Clostridium sp.]|nr:hydrolase [Clostridium sp.]
MSKIQENIKRFEELMNSVTREGKDKLMDYIKNKTDFYKAPASTQFHLSCEGGLLQHSLNVYDCLIAKKDSPIWKKTFEKIPDESLIIMALLHDLCKVNFYVKGTKNQKTYEADKVAAAEKWQVKHDAMGDFVWETVLNYEVKDSMPLGHGEKSVMLINCFMHLIDFEIFAIRWHMGFSEEKSQYKALGEAIEKYPIILALYEADLEASKILEDVSGNKEL